MDKFLVFSGILLPYFYAYLIGGVEFVVMLIFFDFSRSILVARVVEDSKKDF